mgnify:CR=1 FL=1
MPDPVVVWMKIMQKLFRKQEIEYDDMLGYLTKEDMQKLREARERPSRKVLHKKWLCGVCRHEYFYRIIRCPQCESQRVEEIKAFGNNV